MSPDSTLTATGGSRLPDPTAAGFADKLYRLDGGHSLANDENWMLRPTFSPGVQTDSSFARE